MAPKGRYTLFAPCLSSFFLHTPCVLQLLAEIKLTVFAPRLRLDAQGREQMGVATFARFPEDLELFLDHGANINQTFNYCSMLGEFNSLRLSDP